MLLKANHNYKNNLKSKQIAKAYEAPVSLHGTWYTTCTYKLVV